MAGTRYTAPERKIYRETGPGQGWRLGFNDSEPALGTLKERLDILARRYGCRPDRITLTKAERAELSAARVA